MVATMEMMFVWFLYFVINKNFFFEIRKDFLGILG